MCQHLHLPRYQYNYRSEWFNRAMSAIALLYVLGDMTDSYFGKQISANNCSVKAWSQGIAYHVTVLKFAADRKYNNDIINTKANQIKKYNPSYTVPKAGGCYVATCVYGSYDCPQVWALRRYRDNTLAPTWYGRAFVRAYYAVSPLLVRLFGNTESFKRTWRTVLDKIVSRLVADGYETTPYDD